MSKGHRSQIKRERNEKTKDKRPKASLKFARLSNRKADFVLDSIRGKDVSLALALVTYSPRFGSYLISKILKSAIANAKNNNNMNEEDLYVAECYAGQAPTFKRMHPRAQGRAYSILKRNCHITIILDDKANKKTAMNINKSKSSKKEDGSQKKEAK